MKTGTLILALLLILAPLGADDIKILNDYIAAWNSHSAAAVAGTYSANARYEDVPFGIVVTGSAGIEQLAQGFFGAIENLQLRVVDSSLKGGQGTIEYVFGGRDLVGLVAGAGQCFAFRGVIVLETTGNKITRSTDYYDRALAQASAYPPPCRNLLVP